MAHLQERSACRAVFAVFFVAGWLPAAWSTRIPAIKADLDLTEGALAVGILGLEAGAIVGLPVGAALITRLGCRRVLRIGFAGLAPALLAVGCAPDLAVLTCGLAAMALTNSIVDVAMNAQGVELERQLGRTVLSGLHAGHPLGLVAGGVAGTVAAAAEVPVVAHFAIVAAVGVALAGVATCWLVREQDQRLRSTFALPGGRVLLLGLLAFCAFALDGAAVNWSAVDLRIEHQASEALAAAAFTGFALALMIGRMVGDRLVARVGRARLVQVSAVVSGSGAALVVFGSSAALGLIGWVLFGLGLATVAPTVLGAAPRTGDAPPAVAIAAVTSVGYLGSFTGPPVVGLLAQATSLSTALLLLIAIAAALGALAKLALDPD